MATVHLSKRAQKDLKRLGNVEKSKALQAIQKLKGDIFAGHTLSGSLQGVRSLEFSAPGGAYRAASADDPSLFTFKEESLIASLQKMSEEELIDLTIGADRGVAKPLMTSDSQVYDLSDAQKARIQKERKRKVRWQRRASKRQKHSKNQRKAYRKTARYQQYEANVRNDFAHQTSHQLVSHTNAKLIVFEDLKVKKMTKRLKPKQDANGKWLRNGARDLTAPSSAPLGGKSRITQHTKHFVQASC